MQSAWPCTGCPARTNGSRESSCAPEQPTEVRTRAKETRAARSSSKAAAADFSLPELLVGESGAGIGIDRESTPGFPSSERGLGRTQITKIEIGELKKFKFCFKHPRNF